MSPIAASFIASDGSLMKWKVSFVACFVSVAIACRDAGVALRGSSKYI